MSKVHFIPKEVERTMEKQFMKEYRDKHWVPCRHSTDPRYCNSAHKKRISDPDYPTCMRDGQVCDTRWKE